MAINEELAKVIRSSTFQVHDGDWIYAKVAGEPKLDDCFMLSSDKDETTAVFETSKRNRFEVIEQNKDVRN